MDRSKGSTRNDRAKPLWPQAFARLILALASALLLNPAFAAEDEEAVVTFTNGSTLRQISADLAEYASPAGEKKPIITKDLFLTVPAPDQTKKSGAKTYFALFSNRTGKAAVLTQRGELVNIDVPSALFKRFETTFYVSKPVRWKEETWQAFSLGIDEPPASLGNKTGATVLISETGKQIEVNTRLDRGTLSALTAKEGGLYFRDRKMDGAGKEPKKSSSKPARESTLFKESEDADALADYSPRFLSDDARTEIQNGTWMKSMGRGRELKDIFEIMLRIKSRNPLLLGKPGVGKTALVEALAGLLSQGWFPKSELTEDWKNAEVIEFPVNRVVGHEESIFGAIKQIQDSFFQKTGKKKPFILFLDEIHSIEDKKEENLKRFLELKNSDITVIGGSTSAEFQNRFKFNPAFNRRFTQVPVEELGAEDTLKLLQSTWVPFIEERYKVKFDEDAVKTAIEIAALLHPDSARPDGPFKVLQDVAIKRHWGTKEKQRFSVTREDVFAHAEKITRLPINLENGKAFANKMTELKSRLNEAVINQAQMVTPLVDQYRTLLYGSASRPRVVMLMGTTGSGKTHLGEKFAEFAFKNEDRFFEIDGNDFIGVHDAAAALTPLLGAQNGYLSSDDTSGQLIEWLDDPSRGKFGGVILINEADKISPPVWKRLMELLDAGRIRGGDGKVRYTNRHMIILTSNRGADQLFPENIQTWSEDEVDRRLNGVDSTYLRSLFTQSAGANDDNRLPPEIVARIDEYVVARPITSETAKHIVTQKLELQSDEYNRRFGLNLVTDSTLSNHIVEHSSSIETGARGVTKYVEKLTSEIVEAIRARFDNVRGKTFAASVKADSDTSYLQVSGKGKAALRIPLPSKAPVNRLQDPSFVDRLQRLLKDGEKSLIGQKAAIQSLTQSIMAQAGDSTRKTPASIFVVGSTGNGKTELGRTAAELLYGSRDRAEIIDMGKILNTHDSTRLFGAPPGYVGSEDEPELERILRTNPNATVIVWDEFSNVGGGDLQAKTAVMKLFYNMLEEGKWTSPYGSKKTYDLSKHVFVFTGNDSDNLFRGITSDDMRLATWNTHRRRDLLRELLTDSGVPEPLLGRMGDLILMKPLLTSEMIEITRRMWAREIGGFERENGIKVDASDAFLEQLVHSFFDQASGARSVRSVIQERIKGEIALALVKAGLKPKDYRGAKVQLELSDSLFGKPYVFRKTPKRSAKLKISISKGVRRMNSHLVDLIDFAVPVLYQLADAAKATAIHEAGHAVANVVEKTGKTLRLVTIRGGRGRFDGELTDYYGYAGYDPAPNAETTHQDRDYFVHRIAVSFAGRVAERLAGYTPNNGFAQDQKQIDHLAREAILAGGLGSKLITAIGRDELGEPILTEGQERILLAEMEKLKSEAESMAETILRLNWSSVRSVAGHLLMKGTIVGSEFKATMKANGGQRLPYKIDRTPRKILKYLDAPAPALPQEIAPSRARPPRRSSRSRIHSSPVRSAQ